MTQSGHALPLDGMVSTPRFARPIWNGTM